MDFDLPPSLQVSSIPWERILPPLFPWWNGTIGPYSWTLTELLILVSEHTGVAQIACDHNRFTVQVDVKHFSPEDLLVKVVGDYVVVEGKHEQKRHVRYTRPGFQTLCDSFPRGQSLLGKGFGLDNGVWLLVGNIGPESGDGEA
uniref:Heat shock protein, alpha-crystallin-related, b6 n=1 Tax=Cyprinus carpio TaxID=7962 RepID=A0A8C2EW72_CYPCA